MDTTKMGESGRAANVREHTILLAAGTAITMACLRRIMVLFFEKQWRARVFLVLNLVLLAIYFTSFRSNSSQNQQSSGSTSEMKVDEEKKKKKKQLQGDYCWSAAEVVIESQLGCDDKMVGKRGNEENEEEQQKDCEGDDGGKLSKEELNERAEAFIAMFRQHLASDAREAQKNINTEARTRI